MGTLVWCCEWCCEYVLWTLTVTHSLGPLRVCTRSVRWTSYTVGQPMMVRVVLLPSTMPTGMVTCSDVDELLYRSSIHSLQVMVLMPTVYSWDTCQIHT